MLSSCRDYRVGGVVIAVQVDGAFLRGTKKTRGQILCMQEREVMRIGVTTRICVSQAHEIMETLISTGGHNGHE